MNLPVVTVGLLWSRAFTDCGAGLSAGNFDIPHINAFFLKLPNEIILKLDNSQPSISAFSKSAQLVQHSGSVRCKRNLTELAALDWHRLSGRISNSILF